ncbi:MAG: molybdenum ABC transporter ATP-binding protein [Pseudomonadota bacterium]
MSDNRLEIDIALGRRQFTLSVAANWPLDGCTAVFGPSGSGKTTLLRTIAGFERPDRGRICYRDTTWCDTTAGTWVAPHRRGIGVVFQDAALFEHLSVAGNLEFASKRAPPGDARYSTDDVIAACDITELLQHQPATLSGGERQRVALARMLLSQPQLILLDEPLSALDRDRRRALIRVLRRLPRDFGIPTILVSHDIDEVVELADYTLPLREGRTDGFGKTTDVLNASGHDVGFTLVDAAVRSIDPDYSVATVQALGTTFTLPIDRDTPPIGQHRLRIRDRDVAIALSAPTALSIRNHVPCEVVSISPGSSPALVRVALLAENQGFGASITRAAVSDLQLQIGQSVVALVKSASIDG